MNIKISFRIRLRSHGIGDNTNIWVLHMGVWAAYLLHGGSMVIVSITFSLFGWILQ